MKRDWVFWVQLCALAAMGLLAFAAGASFVSAMLEWVLR